MDKKQFEELLDSMGIAYTHTANRATQQSRESLGRYNSTGDWVATDTILHVEPDGIEIENLQKQTQACDHCGLLVDQTPRFNCNYVIRKNHWNTRCSLCKKSIDFPTFMGRNKGSDK